MTEQVQESSTALDAAKLAAGVAILVGGIVGFYMLGDLPIWLRWIIVLAGLVVGALVGFQSQPGRTLWAFVQSSRVELRKVVWPSRDETTKVTIYVFVVILLMGVFFWGVD